MLASWRSSRFKGLLERVERLKMKIVIVVRFEQREKVNRRKKNDSATKIKIAAC